MFSIDDLPPDNDPRWPREPADVKALKDELAATKKRLAEAEEMLKESRYAIDYAIQYGYKPGTLRDDIETFLISTPPTEPGE